VRTLRIVRLIVSLVTSCCAGSLTASAWGGNAAPGPRLAQRRASDDTGRAAGGLDLARQKAAKPVVVRYHRPADRRSDRTQWRLGRSLDDNYQSRRDTLLPGLADSDVAQRLDELLEGATASASTCDARNCGPCGRASENDLPWRHRTLRSKGKSYPFQGGSLAGSTFGFTQHEVADDAPEQLDESTGLPA
jgi:hypothetical protein